MILSCFKTFFECCLYTNISITNVETFDSVNVCTQTIIITNVVTFDK